VTTQKAILSMLCVIALLGLGCKKGGRGYRGYRGSDFPPTEAGVRALLGKFLQPNAGHASLTKRLKPTRKDLQAIFKTADMVKRAERAYKIMWASPQTAIKGKAGQTELLVWAATTEEIKSGKGDAKYLPGGYRRAAEFLKSGLKVYRWKFVQPGERLGMAYDGLYLVNGHWVWVPKPWRLLK
jgi:hypothetical protein